MVEWNICLDNCQRLTIFVIKPYLVYILVYVIRHHVAYAFSMFYHNYVTDELLSAYKN